MKHYVVTDYNVLPDERLFIVMSIPEARTKQYANLVPLFGSWYPVFVYDEYQEAETRCKEMNVILSEKKESGK